MSDYAHPHIRFAIWNRMAKAGVKTPSKMEIVMKMLIAPLAAGAFLVSGVLPAFAAQPAAAPAAGDRIQVADTADFAAKKDEYVKKSKDDMQLWQQRVHDFGEKAKADGQKAGDAARVQLDKAWRDTKAASAKLQEAGEDGWVGAKGAYERASAKLRSVWHDVTSSGN